MPALLIGEVAKRVGVSSPTIRYYEEVGLLARPARSSSGYRRYSERALTELRFIQKAKRLGFSLEEIAEILRLSRSGQTACSHVLSVAEQHLATLDERIRQLQVFREQLAGEVAKWNGQKTRTCSGLCQMIEAAETDDAPDVRVPPRPLKARRAKGAR